MARPSSPTGLKKNGNREPRPSGYRGAGGARDFIVRMPGELNDRFLKACEGIIGNPSRSKVVNELVEKWLKTVEK